MRALVGKLVKHVLRNNGESAAPYMFVREARLKPGTDAVWLYVCRFWSVKQGHFIEQEFYDDELAVLE